MPACSTSASLDPPSVLSYHQLGGWSASWASRRSERELGRVLGLRLTCGRWLSSFRGCSSGARRLLEVSLSGRGARARVEATFPSHLAGVWGGSRARPSSGMASKDPGRLGERDETRPPQDGEDGDARRGAFTRQLGFTWGGGEGVDEGRVGLAHPSLLSPPYIITLLLGG